MLRTLLVVLLLANLAFFGWARGWLAPGLPGPRHGEHEPQRLAAQLRPETVSLIAPTQASAAVSAARAAALVCLEAGPLADAELPAAEAALAALQLPAGVLQRQPDAPAPQWLLYAGRWPDAAARRNRLDELRRQRLDPQPLDAPAAPSDLVPGLVLSRHADKTAADAALAALSAPAASQPVRGLSVVLLTPPAQGQWLRIGAADPELQMRLQAWAATPAASAVAGGFKACATRP